MESLRSIIRMVRTKFQRKKIRLTSAIVIVLIIFLLGMKLFGHVEPPICLQKLEDIKVDRNNLKQDTQYAILTGQADGEVFLAFRLKNTGYVFSDVRGAGLSLTNRPEHNRSESQFTSIGNDKDVRGTTPQSRYPLTLANNTFIINNEHLCSSSLNMSFVVLVHTASQNFLRRAAIRESWANYRMFRNHTIPVAFLVGRPEKGLHASPH
ncbi:hypothetical protein DPMN_043874 [Dreissena polymorpha]|uniref:Hexosyltransferase n=1 Tax=Dreissena polymorpha TaxID=45954 RepID=A0A9D4I020_DREPO|nr:hypothetical protein DPMN_043874 [Dreissena polymorpha]